MNEDLEQWDKIAREWVDEVIPKGKLSEHLTKPALNELLGDVKDKQILDAGCGNGRFSKYLSDLGAKVIGIDGSRTMIEFAKKESPQIEFRVCDLKDRLPFSDKSFDFAVSDAVLMSLDNIAMFLSETNRILKDNGRAVISVLHPAFNFPTMRLYKSLLDKLLFRKVRGLADDYYQGKTVRKDDKATGGLNFYHRTIEQYSEAFFVAGLSIEKILEPRVTDPEYLKKNLQIEYAARLPRFIFFKLKKSS